MDPSFLAKHTHGFSGADITKICQRAAKLAIRKNIKAAIRIAREKKEKEEASDVKIEEDEAEEEDRVPVITRYAPPSILTRVPQ